ncbi:MAG: glycosyltransferase [Gemmataceae bacterium]|nr:glycosyltransferase [Gemmataceae bacterium]
MKIAVVIPVLNEAAHLQRTCSSLLSQTLSPDRLVIVDGGSCDGTTDIARRFTSESLVVPGRGRGGQIAAGTAVCSEDVILVAHADMVFPPNALESVQHFLLRHPACPGGCLGHRFENLGRVYRAIEWWDRRRAMRGHSFGDQGQFFRRDTLEQVGGFPELPLMEDVELSRRLRWLGRPAYLNVPVIVSSRRYEQLGWSSVAWRNWQLRRVFRLEGEAACWRLFQNYYGITQEPRKNKLPTSSESAVGSGGGA